MTQAEYNAAFDEGFEIGKSLCETHHDEIKQLGRKKVLDELWEFCLNNGVEDHGELIGLTGDPFFPLKLIKKIGELRRQSKEGRDDTPTTSS
jgi:hypothetical protein